MWIIVHGGTPKTGTTALQSALHQARHLLACNGILYPETVIPGPAHHLLVAGAMTPERLRRRGSLSGALGGAERGGALVEAFWERLRADVARHRPEGIVLSSEYAFRGMTADEIARLRDQLHSLSDDIRPLAYLREPLGFFASECLQNVKLGRALISRSQPSLKQATQLWRTAFGRLELRIFDRDRLEGGQIVTDLLSHVLRRPDLLAHIATTVTNEALSAEAAQIVQTFRSRLHPDKAGRNEPQSAALVREVQRIEREILGVRRPVLRPEVETVVLQMASEYLWLRDAEGLVFPQLDYERIGVGGRSGSAQSSGWGLVREVFEFDAERHDHLVALLLRDRMALLRRGQVSPDRAVNPHRTGRG